MKKKTIKICTDTPIVVRSEESVEMFPKPNEQYKLRINQVTGEVFRDDELFATIEKRVGHIFFLRMLDGSHTTLTLS